MQILLGAHETIIKINSKSMNIEYIQHYISKHFRTRIIIENSITIPASKTKFCYRIFLLKWFYALYAKKNGHLPKLKESLLKRYYKSIKILLPQKIIHSLTYKIIDKKRVHLFVSPQNPQITLKVKTFLQTKITVFPTYLEIVLQNSTQKEKLKLFLNSHKIIDIPHKHIYIKEEMDKFFYEKKEDDKQEKSISLLEKAYMIFNMDPTNDIKSIKKQYRNLAKKFHPDRVPNDDKNLIKLQTKKFQELLESYEIILKSA